MENKNWSELNELMVPEQNPKKEDFNMNNNMNNEMFHQLMVEINVVKNELAVMETRVTNTVLQEVGIPMMEMIAAVNQTTLESHQKVIESVTPINAAHQIRDEQYEKELAAIRSPLYAVLEHIRDLNNTPETYFKHGTFEYTDKAERVHLMVLDVATGIAKNWGSKKGLASSVLSGSFYELVDPDGAKLQASFKGESRMSRIANVFSKPKHVEAMVVELASLVGETS